MSDVQEVSGEGGSTPATRRTRAGRSGGGAAARRASRSHTRAEGLPVAKRAFAPTEVLSADQLEMLIDKAQDLLQEIGIDIRDEPEALELYKQAGADVQGDRVRIPKGLAPKLMATAPSTFTQFARNGARSVEIGGRNTVFAPVYGCPFVRDIDNGRRYATLNDFENIVKLVYSLPALHHSGGTVCEPMDVAVNKRHLDMVKAHLIYSDKPLMGSVTAPERAEDTVEMVKLVFGSDFVDQNCVLTSLINVNSPLVLDGTMMGALKVYARANQASIVSPFIVGGAMSPTTVAGTVIQTMAEAMAGVALSQLYRAGSPVILGTFASSMSMQTGAPAFGTPEPTLVLQAMGQFARRMNLPFRSGGGLTGSKIADAQAAYESANTINAGIGGGVNFMLHSAGWLEGGLSTGYEKLIMDADQLAASQVYMNGITLDDNGFAMDAFREVGPGNHFLGSAHTTANFESAYYRSPLAHNGSFEQWDAEGAKDANVRANAIWKQMLNEYEKPAIDPAIEEAVNDYVARKKAASPDQAY